MPPPGACAAGSKSIHCATERNRLLLNCSVNSSISAALTLSLSASDARCASRRDLVDAPLLQIFPALHEIPEAARQVLQNFVDHASLVEQRAGQLQQEAAFAQFQTPGKFASEDALDCLIQGGALYGIGEQPPKRGKRAAGFAFGDEVGAGEERFQDFAAAGIVVHDALAKVAIEGLELVAHAAEIAGQPVGQRDDLARSLQGARIGQRGQAALADGVDLLVDFWRSASRVAMRVSGLASVCSASRTSCCITTARRLSVAAVRGSASDATKRMAPSAAAESSYSSSVAPGGKRRSR